jgi:hypothetical protein
MAEQKFSSLSEEELVDRCMHVNKSEEEYLKQEPAINEISEFYIVNLKQSLITAAVTPRQQAMET